MRCLSCNKNLNVQESTRKYSSNGTFVDLCNHCYSFVADDISAVEGSGYVEDFEESGEPENFSDEGWDGITRIYNKDEQDNQM